MFSFFAALFSIAWIMEHWQIIAAILAILILLIVAFRRSKKKKAIRYAQAVRQQEEERQRQQAAASATQPAPPPVSRAPKAPKEIGGTQCAYQYQDVPLIPLDRLSISGFVGSSLRFESSANQVSVLSGDTHIGTMKPGKLCGMVSDWLERGDPVYAIMTRFDESSGFALFDLYFYRNEMEYLLLRNPEAKRYKLVGNRSGELQDNASACSPGCECSVEYDYDKEKYAVSYAYLTIGFLPASAARIIEESDDNASIRVFIADVETDDDDKYSIFVYLFT